jgi:hypothetical protein
LKPWGRALLFFAFFEPAIVQVQRGRQELGAPPIHRDIAAISIEFAPSGSTQLALELFVIVMKHRKGAVRVFFSPPPVFFFATSTSVNSERPPRRKAIWIARRRERFDSAEMEVSARAPALISTRRRPSLFPPTLTAFPPDRRPS